MTITHVTEDEERLLLACEAAAEYIEGQVDVVDGSHGPQPNAAMDVYAMLQNAIIRAKKR